MVQSDTPIENDLRVHGDDHKTHVIIRRNVITEHRYLLFLWFVLNKIPQFLKIHVS